MEENKSITVQISQQQLQQILSNPMFPKNYANSFVVGRTEGDIFILNINNGSPQNITSLSFLGAKKLLKSLQSNIETIENYLGEIKEMPSDAVIAANTKNS